MDDPQECLICSKNLQDNEDNRKDKKCFALKTKTTESFLLQNVLEISQSTCSEIESKRQRHSASRFTFCQKCYNTVLEAERVYKEFSNLEAKWKNLQEELRLKITKSSEKQRKPGPRSKKINSNNRIIDIIRNESATKNKNSLNGEVAGCSSDLNEQEEWAYDPVIKVEQYVEDYINENDDETEIADYVRGERVDGLLVLCKSEFENDDVEVASRHKKYCKPEDYLSDDMVNHPGSVETPTSTRANDIHSRLRKKKQSISYTDPEIDFGDDDVYDGDQISDSNYITKVGTRKKGAFPCEFCTTACPTPIQLKQHQRRAHGVKHKFQCKSCKKVLANGYTLLRHIHSVHNSRKTKSKDVEMKYNVRIKDCTEKLAEKNKEEDYPSESVQLSMKSEDPPPPKIELGEYPCDFCPKISNTLPTKMQHERYAHNIKHEFKCDECQKCLSNGYTLLRHIQSVHSPTKKRAGRKRKMFYSGNLEPNSDNAVTVPKIVTNVDATSENRATVSKNISNSCGSETSSSDLVPTDSCDLNENGLEDLRENENILQETDLGEFVCEFCPNVSKTLLKKKIHESYTHGVKHSFRCPKCNKCLANGYTLMRHIQSVHVQNKPRAKKYKKRDYRDSSEVVDGSASSPCVDIAQFPECQSGIEFEQRFNNTCGQVDLSSMQGCELGIFACDYCPIMSSTRLKKMEHERRAHGIKHKFQCPSCNKCLANGYVLLRHYVKVHIGKKPRKKKYNKKKDGVSVKEQAARKVMQKYNGIRNISEALKCQHCGKLCATLDKKKDHENRAHGESHQFICDYCPKYFLTYYSLECHVFDIHPAAVGNQNNGSTSNPEGKFSHVLIFRCQTCKQICKSAAKLEQHIRKIHGTEGSRKTLLCQQCGKNFTSRWDLRNHEFRVHNIDVPFACKLCKRSYTTEAKLQAHAVLLHNGNEEPVDCLECPKKFVNRSFLHKHMARVHGKEKNYVCQICSDSFASHSELRRHHGRCHEAINN